MNIIKRPIVTEKSVKQAESGVYVFEVAKDASKDLIKRAVESAFGVKVNAVNTLVARGKSKLTRKGVRLKAKKWKKAIVTLESGQKIASLEGV
jgi:large subunit ribosomal protein L23